MKYGLSLRNAWRFCLLLNDLCLYDSIPKTIFLTRIGRSGHNAGEFQEPWRTYFKAEPRRGVTLTADGRQAAAQWFTFLRRVVRDQEEYVKRRFGFREEQKRKNQEYKLFYKLPEQERIRLLRQFCATRDTNERRRLRIEFRHMYGVATYELGGLIRKYGDLVKSARYVVQNSSPRNVQ